MTTVGRLTRYVIVAALITGVTACSDDDNQPTRDEIITQLERDPRTSDAPEHTTQCLADWYLTHATPEQLNALMTSQPDTAAPPQAIDDEQAKAALVDCLKTAS